MVCLYCAVRTECLDFRLILTFTGLMQR